MVQGFTLAEKVKDMTKIELAHMIHNYASCISKIDLTLYQYKTEKFTPKNIVITYQGKLKVCDYLHTKNGI